MTAEQGQALWLRRFAPDDGEERKLWGFTFTLGYSRTMMAEAAVDQKLGTLLRMHEEAFRQLGGVPEEILYDRMKTVWLETDERGEIVWHPVFLDFAGYITEPASRERRFLESRCPEQIEESPQGQALST